MTGIAAPTRPAPASRRPALRRFALALLAPLVVLAPLAGHAALGGERVVHREKSLYRDILVVESDGQRCLAFSVRKRVTNRQSCIYPAQPERLALDYTRMMLIGLYAQPAPQRVLVVGLGGGILPQALARLVPQAQVDSVEIDEAVVRVAQRWFGYRTSPRSAVAVQDGRVYVKRALRAGTRYDLVFLDAYDHEYVPEHLLTREFLREVRAVLAPGGIVVANTFSSSRLYHSESATWAAAFGGFAQLELANRVIVASNGPLPTVGQLRTQAARWAPAFAPLGIEGTWLVDLWRADPRWNERARVLTDQYSPSNLLNR
ncbi:MAG: fused MFS/spermidine synthase [Steroidobacteraceae bacterium]|jgi:spermidine synthase|nr:fused MFS/spermidine synthase [Steroidobacteraceae bacterium]